MTFYDIVKDMDWNGLTHSIYSKTTKDAEKALVNKYLTEEDFKALLSPAAQPLLEEMAQQSYHLTRQRFGNVIQLYIPLYLSNFCENSCVYCGFSANNHIGRKTLTPQELQDELNAIQRERFKHILLVTGEAPIRAGVDYLADAIRQVKQNFSQVSIEVQPLDVADYQKLAEQGLHAVYIYQETYHEKAYPAYHPRGRKANFRYRLETPDRIGEAGIHKTGLGNLIGLEDWRTEAYVTGLHLRYLRKKYWQGKYSLSFPRLRPFAGEGFQPNFTSTERDLTQLICAYRLFDHDVELSLSTRESPVYRDNVFPIGITAMSAGSKTGPGGYGGKNELEQFAVHDDRTPMEVAQAITSKGFDAVWKDWSLYMQMA